MKKNIRIAGISAASAAFLIAVCIWMNNSITVSESEYLNAKIPAEFDGFRIVQISDLHNKLFGKEQSVLLSKVTELAPDIIVVTGDLIDSRRYDLETAMKFIRGAVTIAPVYYVSGNHESRQNRYAQVCQALSDAGAFVMDGKSAMLNRGSASIRIAGLAAPSVDREGFEANLERLSGSGDFTVLLSHHPEYFQLYARYGVDLVFSGHAHGGQIRLPFIGGLYAPGQGLLPKYTEGSHTLLDTTMYVSRGLGNSLAPQRIFNRPELVCVTLCHG